ncbi:unnamed protein product [Prorocentrum cordatum]|nr:unnamed protein product [Polarella glacialis]
MSRSPPHKSETSAVLVRPPARLRRLAAARAAPGRVQRPVAALTATTRALISPGRASLLLCLEGAADGARAVPLAATTPPAPPEDSSPHSPERGPRAADL